MTVTFDTVRGKLRLDQAAFDRLVAWVGGDRAPGPELDALRAAGVIVGDAPHPAVTSVLDTVTDYLCQIRIEMLDDRGEEKSGDGWVGRDGAVLLLDIPGSDDRDFVPMPATLLPSAIARVVRLGPRPQPVFEPLHLGLDIFEGLSAAHAQIRRVAADRLAEQTAEAPLPGIVDRLVTGPWRRWTATMAWYAPGGEPASASLRVIDTETSLSLCDVSGVTTTLWPIDATGVWRRLTLLLPDEVEGG